MHFAPLMQNDLLDLAGWFDDPETRRWLGGPEWITGAFELGDPAAGRYVLVAWQGDIPLALIDMEVVAGEAAFAVVVAPGHRGRGVGRRVIGQMLVEPQFADLKRFWGGVASGNSASEALLRGSGFVPSVVQTEPGFVDFESCR